MWDEDEDNNPYASSPGGFEEHRPLTPSSGVSSPPHDSPVSITRAHDLSDVEYDDERPHRLEPKKGGYESRIEQILYENPDPILITHAGKNSESGGGYIVYTIQTGDLQVRRRYSEFASLRQTLVNLHPTLIIPPIPEKHSMADYAAKPTKAKEDAGIIELRKRMLAVFLNRCRRMKDVRDDGVWWRFLDPNVSWNEVLNTPPVASIPKSILKAPPLNPANATVAHSYLPVPSASARLKSAAANTSSSGMPVSPPGNSGLASAAAHTVPATQLARFPPSAQTLSEEELDPYFINFESSSKDLENLLQGSMEKSNRRMLTHYASLADDLAELGARYNAFSLSEQSPTLATAIEKTGQAADNTYLATADLSSQLSATFAEPMRESAQFAGVVRNVLRYRVLKRVQEEMARDELEKKKALLANLKDQEEQSQRMSATLSAYSTPNTPRRKYSSGSRNSQDRARLEDDVASIDSDFPPAHGEAPSADQGYPQTPQQNHKKNGSGNFISNKIFGRISHAFQGVVDSDPVKTRQDMIGKTIEQVKQLEQAIEVSHVDVKDASAGVLKDLKRFQTEKEDDLKRYMLALAKCHIEWAKRNVEHWHEAKREVENIQIEDTREYETQGGLG